MNISIYSRTEIEKLITGKFPQNTAVVSFYDPPGKYGNGELAVDYKGKAEKIFRVAVYDIDFDELEEFGLTLDTYFSETAELARFIHDAYNSEMDIICQCEYGQSRSAACAAAILEHFEKNGISVFRDYRYSPNQLIFNKVYEALSNVQESS